MLIDSRPNGLFNGLPNVNWPFKGIIEDINAFDFGRFGGVERVELLQTSHPNNVRLGIDDVNNLLLRLGLECSLDLFL